MYKRKENVKEEHLDWDKQPKESNEEKNLKVTSENEVKHESSVIPIENSVEIESDKESIIMTFVYKYEYLSLGIIVLILPYLVGLVFNLVLFYIYSGITLDKVFAIEKEHHILELWTIGGYSFITLSIIWIILKTLTSKSK